MRRVPRLAWPARTAASCSGHKWCATRRCGIGRLQLTPLFVSGAEADALQRVGRCNRLVCKHPQVPQTLHKLSLGVMRGNSWKKKQKEKKKKHPGRTSYPDRMSVPAHGRAGEDRAAGLPLTSTVPFFYFLSRSKTAAPGPVPREGTSGSGCNRSKGAKLCSLPKVMWPTPPSPEQDKTLSTRPGLGCVATRGAGAGPGMPGLARHLTAAHNSPDSTKEHAAKAIGATS